MEIQISPKPLQYTSRCGVSSAYQDTDMKKFCWEVFPAGQIPNHRLFSWVVSIGCMANIPAVHFSYKLEERHTENTRKVE